ncbi:MAG: hypothetical protein WAS73_01145 [Defluviicoccus sp.]
MTFAYHFEAKGIQRFVLDGGRLKDLIGASELVDCLCRWDGSDLLSGVLASVGIGSEAAFSRRAGGGFVLHHNDGNKLRELQRLWTLVFCMHAPGLEFTDALEEGGSDLEAATRARDARARRRNLEAEQLPLAGPFVLRSPRTGRAAVDYDGRDAEPIDRLTQRKRLFATSENIAKRFEPDQGERLWPTNMDRDDAAKGTSVLFPFEPPDCRVVGIVHADGNGMGQMLGRLKAALGDKSDRYVNVFGEFSKTIEAVTCEAVRGATKTVLDPARTEDCRMPARPIVLGGDDVTVIVRADLAIDFATCFLKNFEALSADKLENLPGLDRGTLKGMSAAAGIAFVGANQPYYLAYDLAEALCKKAKNGSRAKHVGDAPIPSSLAFHRITTSFVDDYDRILKAELTAGNGNTALRLTIQPFGVANASPEVTLPSLTTLSELAKQVHAVGGGGGLRQIITLLSTDRSEAERAWRRWTRNIAERHQANGAKKLMAIEDLLKQLVPGWNGQGVPTDKYKRTLLGDLVALLEVQGGSR